MKRIILILIISFMANSFLQGQVLLTIIFGDKLNSPTTEFGLNAGASISTLTGIDNSTHTTNLAIGMFFTWKFHERYQFQPELYFSFKGGAEDISPFLIDDPGVELPIDQMDISRTTNYFSLPLLFKAQVINQFRIIVGPQFSLMTSNTDYMYYKVDKKRDLLARQQDRSEAGRIDIGLSAGIGYKLGKGEGVSIEAKYYLGFLDTSAGSDINSKNRMIILQAGIPIRGFSRHD